jgi:hypothetical protein
MADRDDAAAAYYENPEARRLTGPGRKRAGQAPRLTTHVPIRFSAAVIQRVKDLAADDGKTVSSWVRDVVEREVLRRERSLTVGVAPTIQWRLDPDHEVFSSTVASSAEDIEELRTLAS